MSGLRPPGDPPDTAAPVSIFDRFRTWGERAAPLAALAYALGYASRALHAHEHNFGVLPGVRFEYIVAGALVLGAVGVLGGLVWIGERAATALERWQRDDATRRRQINTGFYLLIIASSVATAYGAKDGRNEVVATIAGAIAACAFLLMLRLDTLSARGMPQELKERLANPRLLRNPRLWLGTYTAALAWGQSHLTKGYLGIVLALSFVAAAMFGARLLKDLPQEYGGVRPKCGVLDLERKALSPELAASLAPPVLAWSLGISTAQAPPPSTDVFRSRPLLVYSTSGPWLIRLDATDGRAPATERRHRSIRLSENAVHSVEWIDPASPGMARGACAALR